MRVFFPVLVVGVLLGAGRASAHVEVDGEAVDAGVPVPAASRPARGDGPGPGASDGGLAVPGRTMPTGSVEGAAKEVGASPTRAEPVGSSEGAAKEVGASPTRAEPVGSSEGAAKEIEASPTRAEPPGSSEGAATASAPSVPVPGDAAAPTEAPASDSLGTTTVRGARAAQSASEVTVAQDVVRAAPRGGATDLLRLVPGLVASQHSGEGKAQQLFLRGFDAVHGQDVELQVAGLPVNEPSHVHALGYADLNWLIPEAVREVRVTEGSYRGFQGDFAVAGTVQYELGLDEPGLTASASYGRFNRLRLFAGVRPTEAKETFAAVEYVQGDGFGPQRAFGRASLLGQAVLAVGPARLRAVVGSAASRFDSPGVVRQDALDAGAGFFDAFGLRQGGSSSRHQLLLGAELPHETGKTTVEVYGALSDLRLKNAFTGFLLHPEGDGLEQQQSNALVGARAHHRRHFHPFESLVTLEVGLGGRRDGLHQSQRGYREADGAPYRDDFSAAITQSAANAWTEVAWLPGRWRFMLGGRVDVLHYEVTDEWAFSGQGATRAAFGAHWGLKAGASRALGEAWQLFLNYGDGFRSPQARSLSDGERAPFVDVRGAEVGAAFRRPRLDVRAALFGSFVARDFFFDHTVGSTVYVGATLRGGAQATVTARPVDGLVVAASLTGAQAHVVDTNSLLPYFAPLVARVDTGWARTFAWGLGLDWTPRVGVGLTFIGPRPLPYGEFSRAVFLADVRAGLRVGRVELRVDVQNLFDARWRDGEFVFPSNWTPGGTPSLLPARHYTAGAPFTVAGTLEVHL